MVIPFGGVKRMFMQQNTCVSLVKQYR